jgi:hypothetical protein
MGLVAGKIGDDPTQSAKKSEYHNGSHATTEPLHRRDSMADSPVTTIPSRISFASAGAVRRSRHATPLPAVQLAHQALMAALAAETPRAIIATYAADRFDILERASHLKTVLTAVTAYAKAIVSDTAELAPMGYVHDETGYLTDATSEVVGALNNACDKMLADQAIAAE